MNISCAGSEPDVGTRCLATGWFWWLRQIDWLTGTDWMYSQWTRNMATWTEWGVKLPQKQTQDMWSEYAITVRTARNTTCYLDIVCERNNGVYRWYEKRRLFTRKSVTSAHRLNRQNAHFPVLPLSWLIHQYVVVSSRTPATFSSGKLLPWYTIL